MAFTVASLNLFHYAEPGLWWYRRDPDGASTHSAEGWARKQAWLRRLLGEIDADVIGFQEVVSAQALRALCAEAGYPHFATVAEPHFSGSDPAVYKRPVNAIASRLPMRATATPVAAGVCQTLGLRHEHGFRRPVPRAEIDAPEIGPVLVYCCHLKSPGVSPGEALMAGQSEPPDDPAARARWRLEAISRAHGRTMMQRMLEASLLFHDAAEQLTRAPDRPLLIVGDFNDAPDSAALRAMTPRRSAKALDDSAACYWLVDARRLATARRDESPPYASAFARPTGAETATHRDESGATSTLDYIIASAALHPWNPNAVGRITACHVHDAYFAEAAAESSDHAAVSVAVERV